MVSTATNAPRGSPDLELELADRHRHGDPEAFARIYRDYEETVYNLALRMSCDPFDAADLTQEVFLRVYRHLGKFRGGSSLKTWIFRVALNHCRSRLKRRRRPEQPPLEADGETEKEIVDERRGPEDRTLAWDARRRVERALNRVPMPFREAVVLCDIEGLAYGEIAEVLGVRIGTVRSRIARGRRKLKEILEQDEARVTRNARQEDST